jgi:hypothetical protein
MSKCFFLCGTQDCGAILKVQSAQHLGKTKVRRLSSIYHHGKPRLKYIYLLAKSKVRSKVRRLEFICLLWIIKVRRLEFTLPALAHQGQKAGIHLPDALEHQDQKAGIHLPAFGTPRSEGWNSSAFFGTPRSEGWNPFYILGKPMSEGWNSSACFGTPRSEGWNPFYILGKPMSEGWNSSAFFGKPRSEGSNLPSWVNQRQKKEADLYQCSHSCYCDEVPGMM